MTKLVIHGDSNSTYTYVSDGSDHWTNIVKNALGFDTKVNLAQGGYYSSSVAAETSNIIAEAPDLVLVMVGTNDIHIPTTDTRSASSIKSTLLSNYATIIDDLLAEDIKVVLISPPFHPFARVAARMNDVCEETASLCDTKGVPFVDLYSYMRRKSETMSDADFRALYLGWYYTSSWFLDVHLGADGHQMVADCVLQKAFGGIVSAGSPPPAPSGDFIVYNSSDESTIDTSSYVFSAKAIGSAHANKQVVISFGSRANAARSVSNVIVAGVTAQQQLVANNTNSSTYSEISGIYTANVSSSTGNVEIKFSGNMLRCGMAVHSFVKTTASAYDTASSLKASGQSPLTDVIDVPASGGVVAAAWFQSSFGTGGMGGVTEDTERSPEGAATTFIAGHANFVSAQTNLPVSVSSNNNFNAESSMVVVSWAP